MQDNSKEVGIEYVAGIIDGEGAIFITHDYFQNKNPVHRVVIRIGMIDRRALDIVVRVLGIGKVFQEKSYHHKRPMFRVIYSNRDEIRRVLDQVTPYLQVKKEQALLAYDFLKNGIGKRGHWLTEEEVQRRRSYYIKMCELNGIPTPATTERTGRRGRRKSVRLEATV